MKWVWWAKDNWLVLVFYFYKVCPKNQTWVVGLRKGKKKKKEKERPLLAEHLEASTLFCHRKGFSMSLGLVCAC